MWINVNQTPPPSQSCSRREGTAEAAPAAVRQAVGGCRRSGWGPLLSVTLEALKLAHGVRETVAGHAPGALEGGGGGTSPSSNVSLPPLPFVQATVNDQKLTEPAPARMARTHIGVQRAPLCPIPP